MSRIPNGIGVLPHEEIVRRAIEDAHYIVGMSEAAGGRPYTRIERLELAAASVNFARAVIALAADLERLAS